MKTNSTQKNIPSSSYKTVLAEKPSHEDSIRESPIAITANKEHILINSSPLTSRRSNDREINPIIQNFGSNPATYRSSSSDEVLIENKYDVPESHSENKNRAESVAEVASLYEKMTNIEMQLRSILGKGIIGGVWALLKNQMKENILLKNENRQNSKAIKVLRQENLTMKATLEQHKASLSNMRADILELKTLLLKASNEQEESLGNIQLLLDYFNVQLKKVSTIKESLREWTIFPTVSNFSDYITNLSGVYPNITFFG